jgi:hypothetical protein
MKSKLLCHLILILLFSACKRDETPSIANPLEGKLKSMSFSSPLVNRVTQIFDYDEFGSLAKVIENGEVLMEWSTGRSDSLVVRYNFYDSSENLIYPFDILVDAEARKVNSISLIDPLNGNVLYHAIHRNGNFVDSVSMVANVSYLPPGAGLITDFVKLYNPFIGAVDITALASYSYFDFSSPTQSIVTRTDSIRIIRSGLRSNVTLPHQSFSIMMPWARSGINNFGLHILNFLQISGYELSPIFPNLPEAFYVNGSLYFRIDYKQDTKGQITEMKYSGTPDEEGMLEFEYY